MSSNYQALARKHRPQAFEDIVGQTHVTRTLQKAIKAGRVHHAYLFAGIRGIGKTTAARVLAKALNCKDNGPTPTPCNDCVSCKEITEGRSMDVMEIDAASNRGIDDIRELREGVRYTTARDRFKMVIIDEVHMLTEQAFNALLKTLEEPPAHVRFILATTDPQKIPATILSRCQRFDFRRVTAVDLIAHLSDICSKEEVQAEEEALTVIVRQTQGSVRDSMSLLDQLIAASDGKVTADWAKQILGVSERRWVLEALQSIIAADAKAALLIVREVYQTGYDIRLFVQQVMQGLRDAMVLALAGSNKDLVDLSESEISEIKAIIEGVNPFDLHYYLREVLAAVESMKQSEFPLFTAEEALVRACSAGNTLMVGKLAERLEQLEGRLGQALQKPALFGSQPPKPEASAGSAVTPAVPPRTTGKSAERPRERSARPVPEASAKPALEPPPVDEEPPLPDDEPPIARRNEKPAPKARQPQEVVPAKAQQKVEPDKKPAAAEAVEEAPKVKSDKKPASAKAVEEAPEVEPTPANKPDGGAGKAGAPYPPSGKLAKADPSKLNREEVWQSFIGFLKDSGRLVDASTLRECILKSLNKTDAEVLAPLNLGGLAQEDVSELFSEFFGRKVSVTVRETEELQVSDSLASDRRGRIAEIKQKTADELKTDDMVTRAVELFPGAKVARVLVEEPQDVE